MYINSYFITKRDGLSAFRTDLYLNISTTSTTMETWK